jgi:hypothetical protein
MTKIINDFQEFRGGNHLSKGTTGKSGFYGIFESGAGGVINADQKDALDNALRDGKITQADFDHLLAHPDEVPAALIAMKAGITYVHGPSSGTSGTSGTSSDTETSDEERFWLKAARTAGKGRSPSFWYDSDGSGKKGQDQSIVRYFSPSYGTSGEHTVGDPGSAITFPEDLPNSAGNDSTTQNIVDVVTRRYPTEAKNKLEVPDYTELGRPSFSGSNFFSNVKEKLAVNKKRRKIINSLKENSIIPQDLNFESQNVLVAVRMPASIKEKYANDFTDLFFLFTSEDRNVEVFLGSTTPSPAFRYKNWYEFYVRVGMLGLIQQKGSYILDDGTYMFKVDGKSSKSDFLKTSLLIQDGGVNLHRYGVEAPTISDAKKAYNYKPGVKLDPTQTPPIFIAPALPFPQEAKSLDATTSGDQVIRRSQDFGKILKAGSGGLKYILKTLTEDFISGEEESSGEE